MAQAVLVVLVGTMGMQATLSRAVDGHGNHGFEATPEPSRVCELFGE